MPDYICQDITQLPTPVGIFSVTDGKTQIPFRISKNKYDVPYSIYDSNNKTILFELHTETNYALEIDTAHLTIGTDCKITFSPAPLHFCCSDERTVALTATVGHVSVGIGDYDPNDNILDQAQYVGYRVQISEDGSGFTFRLLDNSVDKITFLVAWIEHDPRFHVDYEDVIGFWLT